MKKPIAIIALCVLFFLSGFLGTRLGRPIRSDAVRGAAADAAPIAVGVSWGDALRGPRPQPGAPGGAIKTMPPAVSAADAAADAMMDAAAFPALSAAEPALLTLQEVFEGANPAVVAISIEISGRNVFGQSITRPASGSGFFVRGDGYIATNAHVIEGAHSITVLLYDGSEHAARIIGRDTRHDLAVLHIDAPSPAYLRFGDSDALRVGDQVAAIGNPLGELANSMTVGHISALNRDITIDGMTMNKLQTDAAINRGNSGGPLVNLHGLVVGVVSAKSVGANVEGLGFAIPSTSARGIIDSLIEYGFVPGRAILGILVTETRGEVRISHISPETPAEAAGLLVGDAILYANGTMIERFADLRAVLDTLGPGDEIVLVVRRGSVTLSVVTHMAAAN